MRHFKTFTLEFGFDRHLEHMLGYQEMQSKLPVFLAGKFGTLEIFFEKMTVWHSLIFFIFLQLQTSKIDHIWTEHDHILSFINHKSTLLQL